MIMPTFIGFILFYYLPMYGIIIAFKNYDMVLGYFESPWVGIKNFTSFFQDPYFFRILRNTLNLGVTSLIWGFWPPIVLAILLNEISNTKLKKTIQSISYLPHFISMVVIVGMTMELLNANGIINQLLVYFGAERISFFNDPKYFVSIYVISNIWQGIGWGSIVYLSALTSADQQLYEASCIDGANRFQRIIYISIPCITPTIVLLFILNVSQVINVGFEKVYLLQNPAIYETSDVIQTYVYRRGMINLDFSYATAVGLLNSIVALILVFSANKISRKVTETSLW